MVNGGVGQNGERILSRLTIDLMRTNVLDEKRLKDFKSWDTNAEYGYGLGVRTRTDNGWGGNLCQVGEFGWDGAAGAMVSISPERKIAIIYFQHMLNSLGNIIHPKIKNIVNMALADKFTK
jgi:CubicO group peptidase (beta-lactamase class C family)